MESNMPGVFKTSMVRMPLGAADEPANVRIYSTNTEKYAANVAASVRLSILFTEKGLIPLQAVSG